jgi:hypothetical protein
MQHDTALAPQQRPMPDQPAADSPPPPPHLYASEGVGHDGAQAQPARQSSTPPAHCRHDVAPRGAFSLTNRKACVQKQQAEAGQGRAEAGKAEHGRAEHGRGWQRHIMELSTHSPAHACKVMYEQLPFRAPLHGCWRHVWPHGCAAVTTIVSHLLSSHTFACRVAVQMTQPSGS